MATQVTNYQCPACTAPLQYVGERGRLECEFCGSTYSVREIEDLYQEKNEAAATAEQSEGAKAMYEDLWGEGAEHMRAYSCPSCGAELICDDTTAATSCPYCGNPTVIPAQFAGTKRPDYVIPFKVSREEAVAALQKHCQGKPLLPKAFKTEHHIQEIKGVYVPFWLFDGEAQADVTYKATNSTRMNMGDKTIVTTHHYAVRRAGEVCFRAVPVDGSTKMPDDYMDAIEPYDYKELKPFAMAYLPGFLADRFDVDAETGFVRAKERIYNSACDAMRQTVGFYETCIPLNTEIDIKRGDTRYALMPVWMLHTKYRGKDYLFAMNGQTGKMVGELPVSWKRFWAWFAGLAAGLFTAISAFLLLSV